MTCGRKNAAVQFETLALTGDESVSDAVPLSCQELASCMKVLLFAATVFPAVALGGEPGHVLIVERSGRVGGIDERGHVVLPFDYVDIAPFHDNNLTIATLAVNQKKGCIDKCGRTIVPPIWDRLEILDDGTVWASGEITCCYTQDGEVISTFQIPCSSPWNTEGWATCEADEKFTLINRSGQKHPNSWDEIQMIPGDGRFIARGRDRESSGDHYDLLDRAGRIVELQVAQPIVGMFPQARPAGWILLQTTTGFGYIDNNHEISIPCVWSALGPLVQVRRTGRLVCRAERDGLEGFLDDSGSVLFALGNVQFMDFSPVGLARFRKHDGTIGWVRIDDGAEIVVDADEIRDFSELGVAAVNRGGSWGCVDMNGTTVIPADFEYVDWDGAAVGEIFAFNKGQLLCFNTSGKTLWRTQISGKVISLQVQGVGLVATVLHPPTVNALTISSVVNSFGPFTRSLSSLLEPLGRESQEIIAISRRGEVFWTYREGLPGARLATAMCITVLLAAFFVVVLCLRVRRRRVHQIGPGRERA